MLYKKYKAKNIIRYKTNALRLDFIKANHKECELF